MQKIHQGGLTFEPRESYPAKTAAGCTSSPQEAELRELLDELYDDLE